MFLAIGTLCPDVKPVLIECHRRVESRPVLGDELLGRFDVQVTLGVIEEGKGDSILVGVHNNPVLHTLIDSIAQYLYIHQTNQYFLISTNDNMIVKLLE